jgi:30S ribosomal protein S31
MDSDFFSHQFIAYNRIRIHKCLTNLILTNKIKCLSGRPLPDVPAGFRTGEGLPHRLILCKEREDSPMGKGDQRSRRGKIWRGIYGKKRPKGKKKSTKENSD